MGLGVRLALVFAGVAAATALLVGGGSYLTTEGEVSDNIDSFLEERAADIAEGSRDQPEDRRDRDRDNNTDDTEDAIERAVSFDSEVQILAENGEVISNTRLLLPVADIDIALADKSGESVLRTVNVEGEDYRMITQHIESGGAVQVARSLDETANLLGALQPNLLIIAGAVAAAAAAFGWVIAQRTTRPLRALTGAVDEVAETRDFSVPVPSGGRDEVGRLARGFNRMLDALQASEERQRQLVQNAAHELRTPLTSMTANVDWLMRAPDLDATIRTETLTSVRSELGELNNVIAEIIELATDSREAPSLVPTDLVDVADDVVQQFRQRTGRDVQSTIQPVTVMGDADSLARAIGNLLSNADKYSPPGAPVALTVSPGGVMVGDQGAGIPAEDRNRIFDRFYRRDEDRSKPGSGLGLSIVAGIVEQHGGRVVVGESEWGGAAVGFTLPAI